jgi:hypothetical protein
LNLNQKTLAAWVAALWLVAASGAMAGTSAAALPDATGSAVLTGASAEQASFAQRAQAASAPQQQQPVTQIPEPSTTVLMLMGLAGIAWARARVTRLQG